MVLRIGAGLPRIDRMAMDIDFQPAITAFGTGATAAYLLLSGGHNGYNLLAAAPLVFLAATAGTRSVLAWCHNVLDVVLAQHDLTRFVAKAYGAAITRSGPTGRCSPSAYSSRHLREKVPRLKKVCGKDRLWMSAYYVGTAGAVSAEAIRRYRMECQGK